MSDELKACGGCGRQCAEVSCLDGGDSGWWVECPECGARTGCHDERSDAVAAWNRRVVTLEQVDTLQYALHQWGFEQRDVTGRAVLDMLRAAGFEVAE